MIGFEMMARAAAGAVGVLAVVSVTVGLVRGQASMWLWMTDLRGLPAWLAPLVLILAGAGLGMIAWAPGVARRRRRVVTGLVLPLALALLANSIQFYVIRSRGGVHALPPIPLTALTLAAVLLGLGFLHHRPTDRTPGTWTRRVALTGLTAICLLLVPLAQMILMGRSDYRRPADAIVVFGARTYDDGRLSDALRDRMATACALYHEGYAARLIVSGGPGDGDVHETQAMRRFAVDAGVPTAAIELDPHGLNTRATAANTVPLFRDAGARRVLAVSHAYHLPRVKFAYQRQGIDVYTVPARERYVLRKMPILMAREAAAWWVYFLTS